MGESLLSGGRRFYARGHAHEGRTITAGDESVSSSFITPPKINLRSRLVLNARKED